MSYEGKHEKGNLLKPGMFTNRISMKFDSIQYLLEQESKKNEELETGQNVLMLSSKIQEIVQFIKQQMSLENHPISKAIEKFKELFIEENLVLLCKQ